MSDQVLKPLDLKPDEKIIAIRENHKANASFVLSCILKDCIAKNENFCLVLTQNTIGHYHNVSRRLDYDLLKYIKEGKGKTVDFLKEINNTIPTMDLKSCVHKLFAEIILNVETLSKEEPTTIIFEDLSHLIDLGLSFKEILLCLKLLLNLSMKKNIRLVINCHVSSLENEKLCNLLFHSAEVWVIVSALKTGISRNVTGALEIIRPGNLQDDKIKKKFFHFKLEDKYIKVFVPGKDM